MIKDNYKLQIQRITDIAIDTVRTSTGLNANTKAAIYHISTTTLQSLSSYVNLNTYQYTIMANELFRCWNEMLSTDSENFWEKIGKENITIKRKDPLRFAMEKKRFRMVELLIDAKNNWNQLTDHPAVRSRFTEPELRQLAAIIDQEEVRRLEILKNCLSKGYIPQTQYLKFGECMAFFARCALFSKYFSAEEETRLYETWKNFEAR